MFKLAVLLFLSLSSILCSEFDYNYMVKGGSREEQDSKHDHSQEKHEAHHHFWETQSSEEENYQEVLDMETLGKKIINRNKIYLTF